VIRPTRRHFLATIPAAYVAANASAAEPPNELKLWYDKPARNWNEALPLGNGATGAMIYGGVETDHINLNSDTLWSGPRETSGDNPEAAKHLPLLRTLIANERYVEATELAKKMQGPYKGLTVAG